MSKFECDRGRDYFEKSISQRFFKFQRMMSVGFRRDLFRDGVFICIEFAREIRTKFIPSLSNFENHPSSDPSHKTSLSWCRKDDQCDKRMNAEHRQISNVGSCSFQQKNSHWMEAYFYFDYAGVLLWWAVLLYLKKIFDISHFITINEFTSVFLW